MNASGTIRADYVRGSRISFHTGRLSQIEAWPDFKAVDHLEYRANCETERDKKAEVYNAYEVEKGSYMEFDFDSTQGMSVGQKIMRMLTVFPYRDPTWLVATVFVVGSLVFTINAFFGLLPLVAPSTVFETEATVAIPATISIGAFCFISAGIIDLFGAFNAERGVVEIAKDENGAQTFRHRPALLGSKDWIWIPPSGKFTELLLNNRPFLAGVMQLGGGLILSISAFSGFPGVLDPMAPLFPILVFVPQVIGGSFFFLANAILLFFYEQEQWWRPKPLSAGWQAAFHNAVGGFGFAITGVFLLQNLILESAVATFVGSWAFLIGSVMGWYAVMDIC